MDRTAHNPSPRSILDAKLVKSHSKRYPFPSPQSRTAAILRPPRPMAPLPPPLSTSTTSDNTNTSTIPCSCLLSSIFRCQFPFSSPSSHSKNTSLDKSDALSLNLGMVHTQMVSAAERCRNALITAAAENPLLNSFLSLSDTVQRFSQIRFGASNGLNSRHQNPLLTHSFAAILPGDSVAGLVVANGLANFLNLYNTILVVRLVLTWFPGAPSAIVSPLSTICDPYLNIFRGIIPPLGGTLDLSPILAFLVLNAFTSTAAALPAELPAPGTSQRDHLSYQFSPLNLTTLQQKWIRRVSCKQKKVSSS